MKPTRAPEDITQFQHWVDPFLLRPMTSLQKTIVRWSVILAIAAAHFIVGFFALLMSFGASMSRFDSPLPSPVTWGERLMKTLTTVLHFPIVTFWPFSAPGVFGYLVFALNSILWAVCIYAVSRFLLQRVRRV